MGARIPMKLEFQLLILNKRLLKLRAYRKIIVRFAKGFLGLIFWRKRCEKYSGRMDKKAMMIFDPMRSPVSR